MGRGKKHTCKSCGKAFYDLGKKAAVCPSCGTGIEAKKSKGSRPGNRRSSGATGRKDKNDTNVILVGCIRNVIFCDDDKDFLVFSTSILGSVDEVRFVGKNRQLHSGSYFAASGKWVNDVKHGIQYSCEYIGWLKDPPLNGIQDFLAGSQFKGIGPVLSERIIEQLGVGVIDALNNNPSRLSAVDGINPGIIKTISKQWRKSALEKNFDIFMADLGLKPYVRSMIMERPAEGVLSTFFESTYSLIASVSGIGFRIADEIAIRLGVKRESIERITAGIQFAMIESAKRDGHCGMPLTMLVSRSSELLETDESTVEAAVHNGNTSDFLVMETIEDEKLCFLSKLHACEKGILESIRTFTKSEPALDKKDMRKALSKLDDEFDFILSREQKKAIQSSFDSNFSVITGGPGVGKTTIIRGLVRTLKEARIKFALCAPTGRAAKRLEEASEDEATTIHRLLEFSPDGSFKKNGKNPLKENAIICDESSMIDVELMHALFNAMGPGTAIILIGDIDQLPPVGPGQPFRDIINSGVVNISYLQENFRQSSNSGIIQAAVKVNSGHLPEAGTDANTDDFLMIVRTGSSSIIRGIEEFFERLPDLRGGRYNPFNDVQILTPMNKGELGTSNLNTIIQDILNPDHSEGVKLFEHTLARGDKVIQVKNNYEHNVFNGDIGKVEECNPGDGTVKISFDSQKVTYKKSDLTSNLSLAYAITIHKSQGSEYPVVLLIVANEHHFMLARNLVYTGITRGRELVFVIGEKNALHSAARKNRNTKRWTLLSERLNETNL